MIYWHSKRGCESLANRPSYESFTLDDSISYKKKKLSETSKGGKNKRAGRRVEEKVNRGEAVRAHEKPRP